MIWKINNRVGDIILFLLFVSCTTKEYEMDLKGYEPKLAVNSFFHQGELFKVSISATRAITSDEPFIAIDNAEVALYENNTFAEYLVWRENDYWAEEIDRGYYYSTFTRASEGNNYSIEINVPGYDQVTAESIMPSKTNIQYLNHEWFETDDIFSDRWLKSYLRIENTPVRNDYYLFISTRRDGDQSLRYILFDIDDPILGESGMDADANYLLFNNELIIDSTYSFSLDIPEDQLADLSVKIKVYYNLATLSNEAFQYLSTRTSQKNNDPRFSEPVKVFSNVTGGTGIFAAMNISTDSLSLNY